MYNDSMRSRLIQGFRTAANLERTPFKAEMNRLLVGTADLRSMIRVVEDVEVVVSMAIARRDQIGFELTDSAQQVRIGLVVRPESVRELPYTAILRNGMPEFTRVPNGEVVQSFTNLGNRIEEYLPPEHPVRVTWVPVLREQVQAWIAAENEVVKARTKLDQARTACEQKVVAWDQVWTEVYAHLLGKLGKKRAERYFVRPQRAPSKAKVKATTPSETTQTAAAPSTAAAPTLLASTTPQTVIAEAK